MKIELTQAEYGELKAMHKKTKDGRERDKIKAVGMLADGYTLEQVARVLFLDCETISSWRDSFMKRKTVNDWLGYKYVSYAGKLTLSELTQVKDYVSENVISDSKQVTQFIKKTFGKNYSPSGITTVLNRLGFVYKKTTLVPSKYDPIRQAEFKKDYEELEANLGGREAILFMDGVHPQHNTTCTNAWILKGEAKEIKSNTGRQRVNLNGLYNPHTQEALAHESKTINAEAIVASLQKAEAFYKDKDTLYIVLDNAKYYRNELVTEYLKTSKCIFLFLPPYSPNLNLIERLWKFMRKKIINNKYYEKFAGFRENIDTFLKNIPNQRDELRQFIGTKLHLLQPA